MWRTGPYTTTDTLRDDPDEVYTERWLRISAAFRAAAHLEPDHQEMAIKSYGISEITRAGAVSRAVQAASDRGYAYKLGAGARNPEAPDCYSTKTYGGRRAVDCSGYISWCLGFDKFVGYSVPIGPREEDEVWVYTDTIQQDAILTNGYFPRHGFSRKFRLLRPGETVLPGDVVVYDSRYPSGGERIPGHCGIITEVGAGFVRGRTVWHKDKKDSYGRPVLNAAHKDNWFNNLKIAHATPSHRTKYGNVVAITNAYAWRPVYREGKSDGGYIVRYVGFKGE